MHWYLPEISLKLTKIKYCTSTLRITSSCTYFIQFPNSILPRIIIFCHLNANLSFEHSFSKTPRNRKSLGRTINPLCIQVGAYTQSKEVWGERSVSGRGWRGRNTAGIPVNGGRSYIGRAMNRPSVRS